MKIALAGPYPVGTLEQFQELLPAQEFFSVATQEEYEALPPQDRERVLTRAKETFLAAGADGVLLNLSQLPQWLEEQEKED